jgi:hypothetical protein
MVRTGNAYWLTHVIELPASEEWWSAVLENLPKIAPVETP